MKVTDGEFKSIHASLYFMRPPSVGAHRVADRVAGKLDALCHAAGPIDPVTGYSTVECPTEVELALTREEWLIVLMAINQGYEAGAFTRAFSSHVLKLQDRITAEVKAEA